MIREIYKKANVSKSKKDKSIKENQENKNDRKYSVEHSNELLILSIYF